MRRNINVVVVVVVANNKLKFKWQKGGRQGRQGRPGMGRAAESNWAEFQAKVAQLNWRKFFNKPTPSCHSAEDKIF